MADSRESDREETTSEGSDSTDSDGQRSEAAKSSQWLDFQAMSDRISTTLKSTSSNMQKIADNTNISKLVGGFIKEELPKSTEGAWEKVDTVNAGSDSSCDFDDDYDPAAEADRVGKAFGDYKEVKKRKRKGMDVAKTEFQDAYDPDVDASDPLTHAFGDGYRTSKPQTPASCEFADDFSGAPQKHKPGADKKSKPAKPPSSPNPDKKDRIVDVAVIITADAASKQKPQRPAAPGSKKPPRPAQPSPSKPAAKNVKASTHQTSKQKAPSTVVAEVHKGQPVDSPVSDLLGGLDSTLEKDKTSVNIIVESVRVHDSQPSNLDLLMGGDHELDVEFKDDALSGFEPASIPSIPKISELTQAEQLGSSSHSSSVDHLDAFEFFTPETEEKADAHKLRQKQNLASPKINIIAASEENLAKIADLDYLESAGERSSCTNSTKEESNLFDLLAEEEVVNELHIDTSSSSENENEKPLTRDDTVDFDDIISRPSPEHNDSFHLASSEVWAGTQDSGIGVEFKATFSVDDELESCAFTGNGAFESLIDKYSDIADGKTTQDDCELGTKARAEISADTKSVSEKRALKFVRTFSETIDEEDDPYGATKDDGSLSGLGLVVNPMDREDADGEETDNHNDEQVLATSSHRHVWIDMSKPMPRAQVKTKSSKEKITKKHVSSIKLMSQEARQAMQVKVKPVPRPKGRDLQPSTEVSSSPTTTSSNKTKRLVTQGQADSLNLTQLKEHTTLTFEIDSDNNSCNQRDKPLPVLPPPPKNTTPSLTRKNPFNRNDSSESESEEPAVYSLKAAPAALIATDADVCSEINDEEDETECLIGGGNEMSAQKWEALEKIDLPPLEEFRPKYNDHGWKMLIRKPPKKSLTKKRFWEEVYLRLDIDEKGVPSLLLYRNEKDAKKGAKELERARLNPFHQLSDNIYLQQYDQYGKCHSVKVLHVSYKERPSLRTDRVTEALPNFIKGYMKPNKNTIFEHAPTITELYKFGSLDYHLMRMFVWELEDCLMRLKTERINTNTMYQKNEIIADAWDEYEACIDKSGHIVSHKSRVRLFMLCFLSGMPVVEVGVNDRRRRGKEIVRRHEIIPVKAENWITVENVELHRIVKKKEYDENGVISFVPLDGSKFEYMRFRYRPKKNRELPLQIGTKMVIDRERRIIELRADLLIPGYYSNSKRKGQVPCQDIQVCFPIPDSWVYKFRVEKHQKMGSLHAATRKPGKVKGLERITTAFGKVAENYLPPSFIECSVGDAKYEHIFRSVVWRVEKLPRFNEGAYKSHYFALRLELEKHDIIPDSFAPNIRVEFVMPHTTVSGTAIRSISCSGLDEPPEKWVHHHAKYEYAVEIDFESEIKQLLPEENYVSTSDEKPPSSSPVKTTTQQVQLSEDEESSIEIDEDREDSDDTDDEENDSGSEATVPSVEMQMEDSIAAEAQGYATLLDFNEAEDTRVADSRKKDETHLAELLDLTEVTGLADTPEQKETNVQGNDMDLL
ncbi:uncharacterized protein [Watersipora subatra]|uniref:uncharacterized protein n=1 Tax=Watersipora subatra TaxID=2589382 RepID=UPI00355BB823